MSVSADDPEGEVGFPVKFLENPVYLKVKIDGLPIPKDRLVKGRYKPICRDCAIYFSGTVSCAVLKSDMMLGKYEVSMVF